MDFLTSFPLKHVYSYIFRMREDTNILTSSKLPVFVTKRII